MYVTHGFEQDRIMCFDGRRQFVVSAPCTNCRRRQFVHGDDNLSCEVLQNVAQIVVDDNLCRDDNLWCNRCALFVYLCFFGGGGGGGRWDAEGGILYRVSPQKSRRLELMDSAALYPP